MDKGKIEFGDPQARLIPSGGLSAYGTALPIRPPWVEEILGSNAAIAATLRAILERLTQLEATVAKLGPSQEPTCNCGFKSHTPGGLHSVDCYRYKEWKAAQARRDM